MFDDLHDPTPPRPGLDMLAAVAERARRSRRRRALITTTAAVVATLAVGGGLVARRDDDHSELVATAAPSFPSTPPQVDTPPPSTDPSSTAPATSPLAGPPRTIVPPRWVPVLAIGDSVMLGAGPQLMAAGITVDAVVTRQLQDAVSDVESLWSSGTSAESVVVHVGTNGPFTQDQLDRLLVALDDVTNVVVLTVHGDRPWIEENNRLLRAVDAPNVTLLDWAELVEACPGECLAGDGIHLRPDGAAYYAALVTDALDDAAADPPRIVTAITTSGDAVYLDPATGVPVLLFEGFGVDDEVPTEGDVSVVDGVAVLPDESAGFVGVCCEPVAGTLLRTVPPSPATYQSFVGFGHVPVLDLSGTRIAMISYVSAVVVDRDGEQLAISDEAEPYRTLIDVAWIDDTALAVLSIDGSQLELSVYVVVDDRLVERNRQPIGGADGAGDITWPSLAGGQGVVRVLGLDPDPRVVTRFDPPTLEQLPETDVLPFPARSAWFDGGDLIWVDGDGVLHVGDTVVPGEYTWARR